ncbi:MAG: thiol:disulfide interchange protein DsbA/DsbL [Rubrivivax sp.]|nr:thiol:disulfide interchange protein DsbA/DsbL [Rubrivivax sp.]
MDRRDFSKQLAGAGLGLALAGSARAQGGAPEEGKHYVKLSTPVATSLPAGKKVEVIEFFWYGCPHCFALEPIITPWAKRLPADVAFRQMPFGYIGPVEHQKLFYALEEIGQREALQHKIFTAIHVENKRINSEADITAFITSLGVDGAKFTEAWRSFAVNNKVSRGKTLSNGYKIDGVPALGIHGRFYTGATLAGSHERALAVTDFLINRVRQGG